ncbi:MAG: riboflavin synthase [Thermodesulfobacteriota bacterium]|nr:riboflavin synthase [Thermodesulfobacteriota bacterium]
MFTGIIEAIGKVMLIQPRGGDLYIDIDSGLDLEEDHVGDSIAIDGVCLTITRIKGEIFTATASGETISRSTFGYLKPGAKVNIERALKLSSRLGGHLVLGHVDTTSAILQRDRAGQSIRIRISLDKSFSKYVIEKGSIAVDGISLTVNQVKEGYFETNIIPYTTLATTLTLKGPGDRVNIEFDIIGKYVERLINKDTDRDLEDLLKRQGLT